MLKDGRTGTIVHIYPDNENYIIEIKSDPFTVNETETINKSQISEIL
jgi:hypothetical protein